MKLLVFGGSFNPPHNGHVNAVQSAVKELKPDKVLIIPTYQPPHKQMSANAPAPEQRLALCRLAFRSIGNAEVTDLELQRGGKSYTSDTLHTLRELYPDAAITLLVGADMLRTIDTWHEADYILHTTAIAAVCRNRGEERTLRVKAASLRRRHGATVRLLGGKPLPAASTDIRLALAGRGGAKLLPEAVYAEIVKKRYYGVRVNFRWLRREGYSMLRPSRINHVKGCEAEARRLAERWGADPDQAAEAAILHDCTKKEDLAGQLRLCEKYGIIPDEVERSSGKLLHAKTAAAIAETDYGMPPEVASAIRWHTTGKADMSLLEKIIYMADYIEPTRDFEGVETLRKLAYEDLDRAMLLGFQMSVAEIRERGETPHIHTLTALRWYQEYLNTSEVE